MDKIIGKLFARRLKDLMAVRPDLDTQVKLAARAQMSQTTIGRILNAKVSPTLGHVASIADAFGLTIGEVIGQEVDKKAELHYERKLFGDLQPDQKQSIESLVQHKILDYTESNKHAALVIREKRKTPRRKPGRSVPPPGENERRQADERRQVDLLAL
jgi:transcriptional regulator with XRE-family HTH domain